MSHNREPIEHTCPNIDRLIKDIYEIHKSIKGYEKLEYVDDLKGLINEIENTIWDFDGRLEELRKSNEVLREWGIEEAREVDKLKQKSSCDIMFESLAGEEN